MRHLNLYIFLFLSIIYLTFSSHVKFSTNFLEIFFSKESVQLFSVAKKLGLSNEILISQKGFNTRSLDNLHEIAKELQTIKGISKTELTLAPSSEMKNYLKTNYFLLADLNSSQLSKQDILNKLKNIYENIHDSFIYEPIDTNDPLNLFDIKIDSSKRYIELKDYGYVLKVTTTIDTANASKAKELYKKLHLVTDRYSDILLFAPFFYLVENSTYIRDDAQTIMAISTILLLILYFFILKNIKLFFNTVLTIGSSILSAILLTSVIFNDISILSLVFGISITTISIDYMFHYYFHNDFSLKSFIIQKRVLFGFLTTFGVFIIFSFIDIELFSQLAIFSVISLAIAYLLFSWLFIYMNISPPNIKSTNIEVKKNNPLYILFASIFMLGYSYIYLDFDSNLRNLDYQNTKLLELSSIYKKGLETDKYQSIIITAKNRELLLQKYEELLFFHPSMLGIGKFIFSNQKCNDKLKLLTDYNFTKVKSSIDKYSKELGFSKIFEQSYSSVKNLTCAIKIIDDMKFKIIKDDDVYYTLALIDRNELVKEIEGVKIVSLAKTLSKDTKDMKDRLINYMIISILFIITMLFFISGLQILQPLTYLLFPISSVLFIITLLGEINIMHIFALVILLSIGIDYGIYMHKTKTLSETKTAIKYALLSTFSGFGVLIFSSTVALHSIGLVITIGIGAIFILLY